MNITRGKIGGAKKIVVYGPEGIGKSTFAANFPAPVFIDTEGSTKDMDVARFDKATSWAMILQQVQYVIVHPECCRTLIIDTADWAEKIEIASLCAQKGWSGLEDPGYGKGYTYSAEEFGKFLNLLDDVIEKGIHVVMTAHAQLRKVELPEEMGAYDHWEMKTSKKVAPLIREWADAVFFANYKTRIIEVDKKKKAQGGQRVMYTSHTPFWDAKNRYDLSDELPFEYSSIRHIIEKVEVDNTVKMPQGKKAFETKPLEDMQKPVKSSTEFKKEETSEKPAVPDAGELTMPNLDGREITSRSEPDKRIPKALRDLMIAGNIDEWDLQNVVNVRLPGAFPVDMPVKDYPQDFIDEWIMPNWKQITIFIREARANMEVPF